MLILAPKQLLRYVPVIAEQYLVLWSNFSTFVEYLKPIAAQEREVEAARAKERAELEAIRKAEAAKGVNDQRFLQHGHKVANPLLITSPPSKCLRILSALYVKVSPFCW